MGFVINLVTDLFRESERRVLAFMDMLKRIITVLLCLLVILDNLY